MKNVLRVLRQIIPMLPGRARRFLLLYSISQASLALLDIAAIGILALVLTPLVSGSQLSLPIIGAVPESATIWVLVTAAGLIILKSFLSIILQWIGTRRFANYELDIGDRLFTAYLHAPWTERVMRSTGEIVRMADVGIANVTSGILLPFALVPAEIATFFSVLLVLILAQPTTAAITLLYLGLIAAFMYFGFSKRSIVAGRVNRDYSYRTASLMTEMVSTLKEITLRNKTGEVAKIVKGNRSRATRARANIAFLNAVPKYIVEAALVVGFMLVGGIAYLQGGAEQALPAIALFGVAGFRMVPSVTRFQGIMTQTTSNLPHARAVLKDIRSAERYVRDAEVLGREPLKSAPEHLVFEDVTFQYSPTSPPAVDNINLSIKMGSSLGLVGESGAGKSTLIDLLLGLLVPTSGVIKIDEQNLTDVLAEWRAHVGYVPQDVSLFNGSIAQNVALAWEGDLDEEKVRACLERAQLLDIIEARGGIHTPAGERGFAFSGGQRQRLGIARALYSDPLVLVMDEATSALDSATESAVTHAIRELHGDVTVIAVAHRLSTIRHSDQVCYMEEGKVASLGTFDEVVAESAKFANQAHLAGLA